MNKYVEALNWFIGKARDVSPTYIGDSKSYVSVAFYIEKYANLLKELVLKNEIYKWRDPKKELPKLNKPSNISDVVLVQREDGTYDVDRYYFEFDYFGMGITFPGGEDESKVVKWKYIEPYEVYNDNNV